MKKIKTETVLKAVSLLREAKLTNIESATDKYAIIKSLKAMKPVADAFEDFRADALDKLKGENHDDMVAAFRKMQVEEMRIKKGEIKGFTMPVDEMMTVANYIKKYDKEVGDCISEESGKEVELDIKTVSENSIAQLIDSNDWAADDCLIIDELFNE